ncbi:hypothetical protein GCM10020000_69630 [Streptomyces olivoverticillatus]
MELIAKAQDRALKPVEESAALLRDLGAAARGSGLVNRLERLGSSVIRFAWAAAVLGTEIQPGLAANLAGMTPAEAGESADRLREARILVGSERLEFVHPLIATAVYKAIPAATRTAMHGQAAWLSEDAGLGVAVAARHLLEVHPDDDPLVVNQLRAAAREHLAVGAPDAARRCLERALREPPPEEDRAMLLYELGCAALLTSPQTTVNHLRAALALPDLSDDLRVDATYRLSQAYAHNNQLREAAEVVAAQAAATPPGPGLMRLQAARYLWKGIQVEEEDAHGRSRRIAELARHLKGRDNAERALLALRGFDGMIRGENALEVIEAVDRALVDGRLAEGLGWTNTEWGFEVPSIIGITYAYTDRLDEAGKLFDEGVRAFEISGWSGAHLAFAHDFRGLVYRRRGQLTEAEASLRKGLQLAHRLGPGLPIQWDGTCMLIDTLIARGRVEDAQVVAEENSFYPPYSPAIVLPDAACLAGRLLLARGKVKEAVAELESAGHRLQERGRNNTLWAPWALDLAAAIADEEPERARALARPGPPARPAVRHRHRDRRGAAPLGPAGRARRGPGQAGEGGGAPAQVALSLRVRGGTGRPWHRVEARRAAGRGRRAAARRAGPGGALWCRRAGGHRPRRRRRLRHRGGPAHRLMCPQVDGKQPSRAQEARWLAFRAAVFFSCSSQWCSSRQRTST